MIAEFYQRRSFAPAWTRPGQPEAMLELARSSVSHGLDPADYHVAALERLLGGEPDTKASTASAADAAAQAAMGAEALAQAADRDLLLTDSLVRLAYHLHFGKLNPRELYPGWNFARSLGGMDPAQAIEDALAAPRLQDAVERFAPQLPMYRDLLVALARYRAIQAAGGWPQVAQGRALEVGMQDPRVVDLRARLITVGDMAPSDAADARRFDPALAAGVRAFQQRNGLEPDGVVGPHTLEVLNTGVGQRVDQIRVNLERLRWVAQDLAGDYLIVDVAGYSARLFLGGRPVWSSRAVVGTPFRETPAFRATMRDIVFNPTWTVPQTIFKEELLPKLVSDPDWLEANHMRVVDMAGRDVDARSLDWARFEAGHFPYEIVQAPGGDNPLGQIKFLLPNPHDVYLHDTPAKMLFQRAERAFSHGCIRLERPLELAVLLLDDPGHWDPEAIAAAIDTGQTRVVHVRRPVPVVLLYFTAEADQDGVRFKRDLYGRDQRVLIGLARAPRFTRIDR